jgi:uncharacterized OB-fold protein
MPDTGASLLEGYEVALREGQLRIPRCDSCRHWNWYPRDFCLNCGSADRSLVEVAKTGVVHTWTRVRRAVPPVQEIITPYVVVLVELRDAPGVRIPARFAPSETDPHIGQVVDLQIDSTDSTFVIARPPKSSGLAP